MRSPFADTPCSAMNSSTRASPNVSIWLILFISITYLIYTLRLLSSSCSLSNISTSIKETRLVLETSEDGKPKTGLEHIVFGIAGSASSWKRRKNFLKLWWKQDQMRGIVWLDKRVKEEKDDNLPPVNISSDTSKFAYTNQRGSRSAIRITRIVSETFKLGWKDVRWFVMGDDDTVFVAENLVRVLSKYEHEQFYYIGSTSESHLQNIILSYGMAYGGAGFAISYPLANALYKMQDRCIQRYPELYASDDRMHACMAELGVPLTKEIGFHQVRTQLFLSFHCLYVILDLDLDYFPGIHMTVTGMDFPPLHHCHVVVLIYVPWD